MSLLFHEWNWDDAFAVRYEESLEEGLEEGRIEARHEIARNLLAEGSTPEFVQKITGLDLETIMEKPRDPRTRYNHPRL